MRWTRILALTVAGSLFVATSGCVTVARSVRLIAFSNDRKTGQDMGMLRIGHCGIRVMGYGTSPKYDGLFDNVRKQGVRYLNGMSIESEYTDFVVWSKDCYLVRGAGYN